MSTIGIGLVIFSNLLYSIGSFVADFNATHIYNPDWTAHAKFHVGQTMTLSLLLSTCSVYLALRRSSSSLEKKHDFFMSALVGSFYCGAGLAAILYPQTDWQDVRPGEKVQAAQLYLFPFQISLIWIAYHFNVSKLKLSKLA